jgi:hypothetical protein
MVRGNRPNEEPADQARAVAGIFGSAEVAEWVIENLRNGGFSPDQVSVLARFVPDVHNVATRIDLDEAEDVAAGGPDTFRLAGVGEVVVAGPLAGALAGPAAGDLRRALIDQGVPDTEASSYGEAVRDGGILVTVVATTTPQATEAHRIFRLIRGHDGHDFGIEVDPNP